MIWRSALLTSPCVCIHWPRSSIAAGRASGRRSDSASMRAASCSTWSPLLRPTYSEPTSSMVSSQRGSSSRSVSA